MLSSRITSARPARASLTSAKDSTSTMTFIA
jgi:hypothetical protein